MYDGDILTSHQLWAPTPHAPSEDPVSNQVTFSGTRSFQFLPIEYKGLAN